MIKMRRRVPHVRLRDRSIMLATTLFTSEGVAERATSNRNQSLPSERIADAAPGSLDKPLDGKDDFRSTSAAARNVCEAKLPPIQPNRAPESDHEDQPRPIRSSGRRTAADLVRSGFGAAEHPGRRAQQLQGPAGISRALPQRP